MRKETDRKEKLAISGKDQTWKCLLYRLSLVFALFCFVYRLPLAFCDFEEINTGARPMGMGNAFVGLADDLRAIVYNPAGLAYLRQTEFSADYGRLFTKLSDKSNISVGFAGLAIPIRAKKSSDESIREVRHWSAEDVREKTFDRMKADRTQREIKETKSFSMLYKEVATVGMSVSNLSLADTVSENVFRATFSKKILSKTALGFSAKMLYETFNQDSYTKKDPVFDSGSKNSLMRFSFDAGVLYNLYPRLSWGFSAADLNRPNVALNSNDKELLPVTFRTG